MAALELELKVATELARDAGAMLRASQGKVPVLRKDRGEVVTPADRESDARIRAGLLAAFPSDAVFSEETPDDGARAGRERVWIVDPLDGTSNYVAGGDEYVVSVGLSRGGIAVLGVVYNPVRDELFAGAVGSGATLNGARTTVSAAASLAGARLLVSRKEWERGLSQALAGTAPGLMASMAHKLARVAGGLADGVLSVKTRKEWGSCAGVALVAAAGGLCTHLDGSPVRFNRSAPPPPGLLAAGPALHALLLAEAARLRGSAAAS
ncbi:MAG TPA: inositol monophosphatase family protein [Myxococcales bacterium]|nr:inositol monophosphatase family protein [Myxococcales bacterium]